MDMAALPRGSRAACLLLALCGAATGVGATGVVEFNSWLAKSGVANSKVKLAVDMGPGARGMVATADIAAGDSILDIPFSMLMTLNTAQNGPLKEVVNAKQLNPTVILALHLLDEKFNATSAFRPWLEMLPTTFETPIHWSDDELDELQGSTVFSVTKKRKETLQADYTNLFGVLFEEFPALFPRAAYTMEAYQWAISTVWSRSFVFNVEGNMVPVMVPFADMFEHANVDSSFSLEEGAGAFRITTGAAVKAGEKVFLSLGNKPNSQLLLSYGFVLTANEFDSVPINMFINDEDPFHDVKAKILTIKAQPPDMLYYLNLKELPKDFLRALRLQLLKPSELDDYSRIFDNDKLVSVENELEVYRQLISACDTLLKQYPTTALEDQATIQNATAFAVLSDRHQTALVTRFSEKRVLHQTIQLVSRAWSNILIEGWPGSSADFRFR